MARKIEGAGAISCISRNHRKDWNGMEEESLLIIKPPTRCPVETAPVALRCRHAGDKAHKKNRL